MHDPNHDPETMMAIFAALDKTPEVRENYTRVPLGYTGSKAKSLKQILPHLPYRSGYCEPFGGSGAVLLARHASDLEILNDRYSGITSFYRCLRDNEKWFKLREKVELSVHSREEFIYCKNTWQNVSDDVDRAFRWIYMHQMSFGQQERNFARATKCAAQHGNAFRNTGTLYEAVHKRLKGVQIENLDWRKCISDYDSSDMVFYLDPPYIKFDRGPYNWYMTRADHRELVERIFHLEGFVALSSYDDHEANELYGKYDWDNKITWSNYTSVVAMAFSDTNNREGKEDTIKRGYVTEALWIREAP